MREYLTKDGLSGFDLSIHEIMLANELGGNEETAYRLSYAGLGNSGYSYGYNQVDLLSNPSNEPGTPRARFFDILENNGKFTFTSDELNQIRYIVTTKGKLFPEDSKLKARIDDALKTVYGRFEINSIYREELIFKQETVKHRLESADTTVQSVAMHNPVIRAFLFDYHNQFSIDDGGKMHTLLRGQSVTMYDGKTYKLDCIELNGEKLLSQLETFVKASKYYNKPGDKQAKRQADIHRRHKNVRAIMMQLQDIPDEVVSDEEVDRFLVLWNQSSTDPVVRRGIKQILARHKAMDAYIESQKMHSAAMQKFYVTGQSFRALAMLGQALGGPDHFLTRIGEVGYQAVSLVQNIGLLGGYFGLQQVTGYLALGPYSAIAMTAFSIFNMLRSQKSEDGLGNALGRIMTQLADIQKMLQQNFTAIHQSIDGLYKLISKGISQILRHLRDFQYLTVMKLDQIIKEITRTQEMLNSIAQELSMAPLVENSAKLDQIYLDPNRKLPLTPAEISKGLSYIDDIEGWLLATLAGPLVNGEELFNAAKVTDIVWQNKVLLTFGISPSAQVGFFYRYATSNGLDVPLVDDTLRGIVSIPAWVYTVERLYIPLIEILAGYYQFDHEDTARRIEKLLKVGNNIITFFNALRASEQFHKQLLTNYFVCVSNVELFINRKIKLIDRNGLDDQSKDGIITIEQMLLLLSPEERQEFQGLCDKVDHFLAFAKVFAQMAGFHEYCSELAVLVSAAQIRKSKMTLFKTYNQVDPNLPDFSPKRHWSSFYMFNDSVLTVYVDDKSKRFQLTSINLDTGIVTRGNSFVSSSGMGAGRIMISGSHILSFSHGHSRYTEVFNASNLNFKHVVDHTNSINDKHQGMVVMGQHLLSFGYLLQYNGDRARIFDINTGALLKEYPFQRIGHNQVISTSENLFIGTQADHSTSSPAASNKTHHVYRYNPSDYSINHIETLKFSGKCTILEPLEDMLLVKGDEASASYSLFLYNWRSKTIVSSIAYGTYGSVGLVTCNAESLVFSELTPDLRITKLYQWDYKAAQSDPTVIPRVIFTMPKTLPHEYNFMCATKLTVGSRAQTKYDAVFRLAKGAAMDDQKDGRLYVLHNLANTPFKVAQSKLQANYFQLIEKAIATVAIANPETLNLCEQELRFRHAIVMLEALYETFKNRITTHAVADKIHCTHVGVAEEPQPTSINNATEVVATTASTAPTTSFVTSNLMAATAITSTQNTHAKQTHTSAPQLLFTQPRSLPKGNNSSDHVVDSSATNPTNSP